MRCMSIVVAQKNQIFIPTEGMNQAGPKTVVRAVSRSF
jgi:hypothetical protein